jgi:hypothetical protein
LYPEGAWLSKAKPRPEEATFWIALFDNDLDRDLWCIFLALPGEPEPGEVERFIMGDE